MAIDESQAAMSPLRPLVGNQPEGGEVGSIFCCSHEVQILCLCHVYTENGEATSENGEIDLLIIHFRFHTFHDRMRRSIVLLHR